MIKMFQVKKGDQFSFIVTFKNMTEELTTLDFGVKADYDGEMLLEKEFNDGVTKIASNKYQISFSKTDTSGLDAGLYIFDLRYTIGDITKTPLSGYLIINDTVFNN